VDWSELAARYDNRQAFIARLVETALKDPNAHGACLHAAVAAENLDQIGQHAHAIKGLAGSLCSPELMELAEQVQVAARAGDRAALSRGMAPALAEAYEAWLTELAAGPESA